MTNNQADSDSNGLICAYALNRQGGGRVLDWSEIAEHTTRDGLLWVHLDFSKPNAHKWIHDESGLEPAIADAMLVDDSRPRSLQHGNGILTVLRGVNTNPGSDPEDMVSIRVWIETDRIISTRRRRLFSVQDIRNLIEDGRGPCDTGAFLIGLIDRLGDRIGHVVDDVDGAIEAAETKRTPFQHHRDLGLVGKEHRSVVKRLIRMATE